MMDAFTLGSWHVEPERNRLSQDAHSITIENKSMDVLVLLASRPGHVLSNDDIIDAVWGGRPMGENPVYKCIASLRSALGDDSRSPTYIETIPRKGYRLVAPVSAVDARRPPTGGTRMSDRNIALVVAAASLLIVFFSNYSWRSDPSGHTVVTAEVPDNSIVVLPFESLSANSENDFFGYGIAEELLNRLAEMPELRVVARHSSFSRGDIIGDIPEFAKRLGVHYVLSGSVRQDGNAFRVNARLLDQSGSLVWTDSYDRDRDNIVALQEDIANAVAKGLALNVGDTFRTRPGRTANFDAYSSYLIGNELKKRRSRGWGPKAIAAFEEAIRLDPDYAAPYAGLAAAKLLTIRDSEKSKRDADLAIATALRLNPNLAEAHAAAGLLGMMRGSGSDYRGAKVSLRRATELNPSITDARMWLSTVLMVLGEKSRASQMLEETILLDPINPLPNLNLGWRYHLDGRLDAARAQFKKSLRYPGVPANAWFQAASVEWDAGRLDLALDGVKQAINDGVFNEETIRYYAGLVAVYYAQLLMFDKANQWMAASRTPVNSHWRLGNAYKVFSGQDQPALFEKAMQAYEATLTGDKPLALQSRSLIGRFAVRHGEYERGIRYLEPVFPKGWVLQNAAGGTNEIISTSHFLALALQRTGQVKKAQALLESVLEKQLTQLSGQTRVLGHILAREAVTYLLLGEQELALTRFEDAVAADWRDYYSMIGNPCWDGLRGDPKFELLLAKMKQDIDTQRERVLAEERIHPFNPPADLEQS